VPPNATYAEFAPAAALRPYVACYWAGRPDAAGPPREHRVLPDGCIDIILELGAAAADEPGPPSVVGTMTRALVVPPGRRVAFLGVRFRPGGAHAFLRTPADALTDQSVALGDLWGSASAAAIAERVAAAPGGIAGTVRSLEGVLLERLAAGGVAPPPPDVAAAVGAIVRVGGAASVASLSDTLGVTRQHLARQFARYVGIAPKTLCRVVRAQQVVARAARAERVGWSALAYELGYADQSHLVSDFKELAGVTPDAWWRERRAAATSAGD
jgi:AraC-like DNA-binding protein